MANEGSATAIAAAVRDGSTTAVAVAERALDRARAHAHLNAFVHLDEDAILRQAAEIDVRREAGAALGPLAGVPVAIKDNLSVLGQPMTCASRMLSGYRPVFDAEVVERLRSADAVLFGKTAMDEFAMGSSGEYCAQGPTRNPHDPERVPGGSSSGSAAAVGGGIVPLALGSDTGGSIRLPASFCGCVGFKPTYGRVSRRGLVAFASSLDQIGPFAANVDDAALLYGVIAGHDPRDATSSDLPVDPMPSEPRSLEGLRVGVVPAFGQEGLDPAVVEAMAHAQARLQEAGAVVVEVELPHVEHAVATYYVIASAEASSNLARFDGVHYGWRDSDAQGLQEVYTRTRTLGFGPEVRRRILLGTFVLSSGYIDAYYGQAQRVRTLFVRDYEAAFARCDLLLTPTGATPAFRLGERSGDPLAMYMQDLFTIPANLAGLPALSLPAPQPAGTLPVGVQLTAPAGADAFLLHASSALEACLAGGAP